MDKLTALQPIEHPWLSRRLRGVRDAISRGQARYAGAKATELVRMTRALFPARVTAGR